MVAVSAPRFAADASDSRGAALVSAGLPTRISSTRGARRRNGARADPAPDPPASIASSTLESASEIVNTVHANASAARSHWRLIGKPAGTDATRWRRTRDGGGEARTRGSEEIHSIAQDRTTTTTIASDLPRATRRAAGTDDRRRTGRAGLPTAGARHQRRAAHDHIAPRAGVLCQRARRRCRVDVVALYKNPKYEATSTAV